MKKLTLTYLVLTVIAVVGYSLWVGDDKNFNSIAPKTPPLGNSSSNEETKRTASVIVESSRTSTKQLSAEGVAAKQRYEEAKARSKALFGELGKTYTPEYLSLVAEAKMKLRAKKFDNLFSSWNLDSATRTKVLEILNEREKRLAGNRGNYLRGSQTAKETKDKKAFDQAERLISKELLMVYLGDRQATDILQLVEKLEQDEFAAARERLRE
ncbi:MAG: hypothetical protein U1F81_02195 [Verrucomicrobiaceae bacterium]